MTAWGILGAVSPNLSNWLTPLWLLGVGAVCGLALLLVLWLIAFLASRLAPADDLDAGSHSAGEGWLHRLKYRAIVGLPQECRHDPSATMVLGRYGDVVVRPNATAFLSWYPSGLRGWCHDLAPPDAWNAACTGQVPAGEAAAIGAELIAQVSAWYPTMAAGRLLTVDAGAIFAYGKSDVDDANSGLHDRTIVGIRGDAGYLSVDPGKLTTAPLFAVQAVDRLLGLRTSPLAS